MKKYIALLYCLVILLTLSTPAYAASGETNGVIIIAIVILFMISGMLIKVIEILFKLLSHAVGLLIFIIFLIYMFSQSM